MLCVQEWKYWTGGVVVVISYLGLRSFLEWEVLVQERDINNLISPIFSNIFKFHRFFMFFIPNPFKILTLFWGIELLERNVNWARQYSAGSYCQSDGRVLDWVPDNYFDRVISYGALYSLQRDEQCTVVKTLIDKLKPGGTAWFGYSKCFFDSFSICLCMLFVNISSVVSSKFEFSCFVWGTTIQVLRFTVRMINVMVLKII